MENALNRARSHIYRALLKDGLSNFSIEILEYCDKEKCIEREDFYLSSLPHEYNILEKAGSRLGSTQNNTRNNTGRIILCLEKIIAMNLKKNNVRC